MTEQRTQVSSDPFAAALLLVKLDYSVQLLEKQVQTITSAIAQHDALCNQERAALTAVQTIVHNLRKQLAQYELEDKTLLVQERTVRKKLDTVASTKEFQALTKELEELQLAKKKTEEQVFGAWSEIEAAQEQLQAVETQAGQTCARTEQKKQELFTQLEQTQTSLAQELDKRQSYCDIVNPEWLQKYETMRKSVPNPVVPVVDGSCGACSFDIVHADLMQLERHVFLPCRGCYRLLYIE